MAYFADVIPGQSASVVACFNLCRNVAAALAAAVSLTYVPENLFIEVYFFAYQLTAPAISELLGFLDFLSLTLLRN